MAKPADISLQDSTQEHQLHILLVEDNPVQQMFVAQLLKRLGHQISVANDGFEVLSTVHRDRCYDVILMDCQMPLMDGLQATRFIRKMERTICQRIPIIGMSAAASPDQCFEAGMDDFLSKPLNKPLVQAVLGRWIREKKGRGHMCRRSVE
jgi:CheY-like chemotaxis protein